MNVGVIGLGHVGLVTAACFAHVGHRVIGVDSERGRVEALRAGRMPFYEPELEDLVHEGIHSGRLEFTPDLDEVVRAATVLFICVGTPPGRNGEADLAQIEQLAWGVAEHLHDYRLLVEKSTVPVLTGKRLTRTIGRLVSCSFDVASNPEFLREGTAVSDTLAPDRIVLGCPSGIARDLLTEVYEPIASRAGCEVVVTDVQTAELIKHASNAFLATKISFINGVSEICEQAGADVETVARGMGLDARIGPSFLRAGAGYGGSCFPKDVAAFACLAEELDSSLASLLRSVQSINEAAPQRVIDKLKSELWHLGGKKIAVLGLAFKPGTDDLREAPSLRVIDSLLDEGAEVTAYDPVAVHAAKELWGDRISFGGSGLGCAEGADALIVMTEWEEFQDLDPAALRATMRLPIVIDGRNLFEPAAMAAAGIVYHSFGRAPLAS